jgi:hypothetical protein
MDALRYAFEDVKFFKPQKGGAKDRGSTPVISGTDLNGGWDL